MALWFELLVIKILKQTVGLVCLLGVLLGVFVELYGCRPVMLFGGAILAVAFFISAFATNVYFLYFSYAALGGK